MDKWAEVGTDAGHVAYVDLYSSLGASIWLMKSGRFDVHNFFEFCNLLEAIVIYDRLYVTPNPSPPRIPLDDLSELLVNEHVLRLIEFPPVPSADKEDLSDDERLYRRRLHRMSQGLRTRGKGEYAETLFGIGAHTLCGMQLHPSVYNRSAYLDALEVEPSLEATYSLMRYYSDLSKAARREYEQAARFRGVASIFIPPIPALILSKVSSLSEIPEEIMLLRDELSNVRTAFSEYRQIIQDDSLPLNRSLKAQARLQEVLSEITAPLGSRNVATIAEWRDLAEAIPDDLDIEARDVKSLASFFLGKPLEVVSRTLARRKFLQLYSLRKNYFRIGGIGSLIQKLWQYTLTRSDVEAASSYAIDEVKPEIRRGDYVRLPYTLGFEVWDSRQREFAEPVDSPDNQ